MTSAQSIENARKPLVIYHANCNDGFAAALAPWKFFGSENVDFFAAKYQEGLPPNDLLSERAEILIVDFSYPAAELAILINEYGAKVMVIDHHIGAKEELQKAKEILGDRLGLLFNNNHSGAMLTWSYFYPKLSPLPRAIYLIEDWDLWKFSYEETKAFNAGLRTVPMDFGEWDRVFYSASATNEIIYAGQIILDFKAPIIADYAARAAMASLYVGDSRIPVLVVNCPYFIVSEVGNAIAEKDPEFPAVMWEQLKDGSYSYSLRSVGEIDVSKIAKWFGGGGHKHAAGFKAPIRKDR